METLSVQKRDIEKKKLNALREQGFVPGILYGPKLKPMALSVEQKQFDKVYQEAGESSLVAVQMDGTEFPSLIHEVQRDPLSGVPVHVDFYQPDLTKETEVSVPLVFEGEAPGVKELGGTLLRNIQEIAVSALPQNLPSEIVVPVEGLKTFEDKILVKDIVVSNEVTITRDPEDLVAQVVPAEDVDAELEAPIEEDVTSVEGGEEKEEAEGEEGTKEGEEKTESEEGEKNKD
ncbi:MAG TPA: 50S ribosomal protein L25 [Candidatus Wildermuthbacteria bacterium]|nr:50S ribosomal protein L25 [Candidatus Wildermuthbacteria bacterium]